MGDLGNFAGMLADAVTSLMGGSAPAPVIPAQAPANDVRYPATGDEAAPGSMIEAFGHYADAPTCEVDASTAEEALGEAKARLAKGAKTKPEDANAALDALRCLSPEEQTKAMKDIDPATFRTLLTQVPKEDRVNFETLVANCHDPKKKLELWGEFQKSEAQHATEDKWNGLGDSPEDQARKKSLEKTLKTNDGEVDDEVKRLLAKKDLSEKEVQALMDRKAKEREMELKYDINLGYDAKETDAKKRRDWNANDLAVLEKKLANLPPDQHAYEVGEFRRTAGDDKTNYGKIAVSDQDLRGGEQLTVEVAVARAQGKIEEGPFTKPEDGAAAMNALRALPPAQREAAVKKMAEAGDLTRMMEVVPADQRQLLDDLTKHTKDPALKLSLWQFSQKGKMDQAVKEEIAKLGTSAEDQSRKAALLRAAAEEAKEIDSEAKHLRSNGLDGKKLDAMMKRKDKEQQIELKYGVNLTNDSDEDIAAMPEAGDRAKRTRRVWEEKQLEWVEASLKQLSPKMRSDVREYRRASGDFNADGSSRGNVLAQHHPKNCSDDPSHDHSGQIEIFDGGLTMPGSFIHEIGHNADMNNTTASDKYKGNIDKREQTKAQVEAAMTPAQYAKLMADTPHGGHGERSVEVNGRVYTVSSTTDPTTGAVTNTFGSYDAHALPRRGDAERTSANWDDEHDYARTNTADAFADHFKLAARDPVRTYQDYVDGPQRALADAETEKLKIDADPTATPAKKAAAAQALQDAKDHQEGLAEQYRIMREEVFGLTKDKVKAAGDSLKNLSPAERKAFDEQAARCSTPDQLEKLKQGYAEKKVVDPQAIDRAKYGVPADQRDAFARDAALCFTPAQLENLRRAYASGQRSWDAASKRPQWNQAKLNADIAAKKPDHSLLGY